MKKIITVAILSILVSTSLWANEPKKYSFNDLYKEYSKVEGVEVVDINGFLIGLASLIMDDLDYSQFKNIDHLTILDLSSSSAKSKRDFKSSIDKIDDMELLMEFSEDSETVKILIEKQKEKILRFVIIEAETPTVICIKCDMNMEDLNQLVAKIK